jgi:hypothetical protein
MPVWNYFVNSFYSVQCILIFLNPFTLCTAGKGSKQKRLHLSVQLAKVKKKVAKHLSGKVNVAAFFWQKGAWYQRKRKRGPLKVS